MTCFVLITLWVQDELSYDRFHKYADQIYMLLRNDLDKTSAVTTKMLAPALVDEIPEVIDATSFAPLPESFKASVQYEDRGFEENITLAEPRFFDIFSFEFKEGDPLSAFANPNSVIMTERLCEKYFGSKNPIGKSVTLTLIGQKRTLTVTGIVKNLPPNSHIQRDLFIPIDYVKTYGINWDQWQNQSVYNYIRTQNEIDVQTLEQKILSCKNRNYAEENISYTLLPIKKIHLNSNNIGFLSSSGDMKYVTIFSIIAAIILLIACMNYMNLSNALSLRRAREIGIQKVIGARHIDLMWQYFGETLLLTLIALVFALFAVELVLPVFNGLCGKSMSISLSSPQFLIMIFLTLFLTTLVSGFSPVILISAFKPVQVLKGKFHSGAFGTNLRKGLIIFQFSISIGIIICTLIVLDQLNFIKNTDLGYDKTNVVCLEVRGDISNQYNAFKNRVMEHSSILNICRSEPVEAAALGRTEDVKWSGKQKKFTTWILNVDSDFAATYRIQLKSGRFYSDSYATDQTGAYVLNEAAIREMQLDSPLGKDLSVWNRKGKIIGITKNFHFSSLHHAIEPVILRFPDPQDKQSFYRLISVRFESGSTVKNMALIRDTWKSFFPDQPFSSYFLDENLNASYHAEQLMSRLFKSFSLLAVFIACLGLYGLTAFTIEQKFKDIGVHKTLGATHVQIVNLLSKSYMRWIIFSNLIAWPLAWFSMNRWLQNFAYRTSVHWWMFLLAGGAALIVAWLTVSWQAIRAATANPVKALRYE